MSSMLGRDVDQRKEAGSEQKGGAVPASNHGLGRAPGRARCRFEVATIKSTGNDTAISGTQARQAGRPRSRQR